VLTSLNLILAPPTAGVRASSGPRKVLSCRAVPRPELVEAGGKALVGTRHRRIRLLLFTGVLAVLGFIEPLLGAGLRPLLRKPALDIGQGSRERELSFPDLAARVPEIEPLHSVGIWPVASLAHLSATSFPSTPRWLGHHRISILAPGSFALRATMCFLAMIAYSWPSLGSSEVILQMAAWASVKMVTVSSAWFLDAATRRALAIAAHSAS